MRIVNLVIDLPEDETLALKAKAKAQGLSAEEYARQVLEHDFAPEWLRQCWATAQRTGADRLSMEEIDSEIAAARKARRERYPLPDA
jgi:plasmid stability protein